MGNGRWRVQCFGRVMEPKKSFRTSSALSHACHSAGSAVSDPMCVWLSATRYIDISYRPMSVKDNTHHNQKHTHKYTHTDTRILHHEKGEQSCSGPVKPSNLPPPDKHPLNTVTFLPTQAESGGCKCAWPCVCVFLCMRLCVHVCLSILHTEITGPLYKERN